MEWDVWPSRPVLTLRIGDISRYANQDAGIVVGWSCSGIQDDSLSRYPAGHLTGI